MRTAITRSHGHETNLVTTQRGTASRIVVFWGTILCLLLSAPALMHGQTPPNPQANTASPMATAHEAGESLQIIAPAAGELKVTLQTFPPNTPLKPGMAVLLSVEGLGPGQTATWHRVQTEGGAAIWVLSITTDGEAPPPPMDEIALLAAKLADGLDGKPAVAKMFADAIPRIESEELSGSKAIVDAVSKPIAELDSADWQKFSRLLYGHLMGLKKAGLSQEEWAAAYKSVVAGLQSKGDSRG